MSDENYGDNRPEASADPMLERFAEQYQALLSRAQVLLDAEARVPEIVTEELAGRITDYVRQIKACGRALEEQRKLEKEEYLAICRRIDGWFGAITQPLLELVRRVEGKLSVYLRMKEAAARKAGATGKASDVVREATGLGGVLTGKQVLKAEITDPKTAAAGLWDEIDADALEKAARAYGRKHRDEIRAKLALKRQPLRGVRFTIELEALTK